MNADENRLGRSITKFLGCLKFFWHCFLSPFLVMAGNPKHNGKWNQKFITEKHKTQEIKKRREIRQALNIIYSSNWMLYLQIGNIVTSLFNFFLLSRVVSNSKDSILKSVKRLKRHNFGIKCAKSVSSAVI